MSQIVFEPEPGSQEAMPQIRVPRGPLYGALAVVTVAAVMAVSARLTGVGATREAAFAGQAVERHALRFADAPDGGILVYDGVSGALAGRVPPGGDGFLRGSLRAMTRGRMLARVGPETPVRPHPLERRPAHARRQRDAHPRAVSAFGPTQVESFERLFAMAATR
jgi:putative photosynthetic complex assembly protein